MPVLPPTLKAVAANYDTTLIRNETNGGVLFESVGGDFVEIAEYIVAAVNACAAAGLTVEALQNGVIDKLIERLDMARHDAEMLLDEGHHMDWQLTIDHISEIQEMVGVSDTAAADQQALKMMAAPVFALGDYVEAIVDIDDRMMYPNDGLFVDGTLVYPKGSKGYVTYAGDGADLELAGYGLTITVQFDDRDLPAETWQVNPRWFKLTVRDQE